MVKVVAKTRVKAECVEQYKALTKELVEKTQKEEGNISYTLNQSTADERVFAMIEVWQNDEALKAHMASEHFQKIIPQLGPLAEEGYPLEIYNEV